MRSRCQWSVVRFSLVCAVALQGCGTAPVNQDKPTAGGDARTGTSRPEAAAGEPSKSAAGAGDATSLALFEKRILPLMKADKPSSCAECHLSGVDLSSYIQPTQKATFASLRAAGLIDLKSPDDSKILKFILRKPPKSNLIRERVRKEEFAAFQAWIRAAVTTPELLSAAKSEPIGPQTPAAVIRHARRDRVLASFIENVWTEVGRCAACHSPDRNRKQVQEHGEQVSWIRLKDPQGTLDHMVDAGIINPDEPLKSLLLMKPTMQVEHGGGQKMVVGDRTYKQFRRFIDDYSAVVKGRYASAQDLPKPSPEVSIVTDIWLKLRDVPASYDKKLLQTDLYRWTGKGWTEYRVATSDRPVFGKGKLWQHSLSLTAPRDSEWAKQIDSKKLPAGRYLVKISIDLTGRLQQNPHAKLTSDDFVGQVEVETAWPAGYGKMTVLRFPAK